ncbi:kinase-like domain-containing protein [Butyriboletus roseoflavus]|nr:kinase-like domain-containing protein [Butyriboletus roseoflavus]
MQSSAVDTGDINADELPDLTDELLLDMKNTVGTGSFGVVYRCPRTTKEEVAVKMVIIPSDPSCGAERDKLTRGLRRELGIWRRLDHPNIVPLLGKTSGVGFGSEHDCMVSMWMPGGTLSTFIKNQGAMLVASRRVQLIEDIANGLNYLHSKHVVHGDFHPGNVLIDGQGKARITDFGLSQLLLPTDDGMSCLRTLTVHPGAVMWAAPELVYPQLHPKWNEDGKPRATLNSDIYSFGNMILFILSEKMPWPDVPTAWKRLKKHEIPRRREFAAISDDVWKFLKKCWSPRAPDVRPSAQEILSFISDNLESLSTLSQYGSSRAYSPNILIFGETGVGKSSVINLIAGEQLADISSGSIVWTVEPVSYDVVLADSQGLGNHIRLFDTVGLNGPICSENDHFTAIEKAHLLVTQLQRTSGICLLIFCIRGGRITQSVQSNYRLFRHILCQNQVPVAFVITGMENEQSMEGWWDNNAALFKAYGFSWTSHVCVTATRGLNNCYDTQYQLSQIAIRSMLLQHLSKTKRTVVKVKDLKWHLPGRPKSLTTEELTRQLQDMCKFSRSEAVWLADKMLAKRIET